MDNLIVRVGRYHHYLWHVLYLVVVLSVGSWVPGKKYVVKCLVYLRMMYWVTRLLVDLINVEDCECYVLHPSLPSVLPI